ncbi:MAG: hypothetical protein K5893_04330 [Prevotella sp.]|nr:hypothetical protein [Prevotella sp.]
MKRKLLYLFILSLFPIVLPAQETVTVSTLAELQVELEKERSIDIVVSNKIVLTNGTNLDGHGRTIRVPYPYLKEDGTVNAVKNNQGYLRNGPEDATTTDNGNVFTIPTDAIVTLKNMTIMGGRIKFATGNNYSIKTVDGIEWDRVDTWNFSKGNGPEYNANAAVVVKTGGTLTMTDCTVTRSNRGIHNYQGTVVLSHCNLIRNYCRFGAGVLNDGGAVKGSATIVMDRCSFSENRSYQDGGAAENKAGGIMYIHNSTVSNNTCATYAINNYSANPATYPSELYFMNCTISGNLVHFNKIAFRTGQGNCYAVNSILTDNVHFDIVDKDGDGDRTEITNVGFSESPKENAKTYLYNCISTTNDASSVIYTNCKVPHTTQDIFADYITSGLTYNHQYEGNGSGNYNNWATNMLNTRFSNAFAHTALVNKDGHYSAPVKKNGGADTGGTKTYFDYSLNGSTLTVNMSYGDSNTALGDCNASEQEVNIYIDGTTRAAGVIGSSPVVESTEEQTEETYHTLFLDPDFVGGNVDGATIYGDTYVEGTEVTVTAIAKDSYAFMGWYVKTGDGEYGETLITSNPYTFPLNARTTIKPMFETPHYHEWVYEAEGATAIAYCSNENTVGNTGKKCTYYGTAESHPNYLTLTITPPAILQTNGNAKYAVVTTSKLWPAEYTVKYYSSTTEGAINGGTYLGDDVYPVESGHYYAVATTGKEGNYVEAKVAFTLTTLIIKANQDPKSTDDYYSTFYSSVYNYKYPSNVISAYTAVTDENVKILKLTKLEGNIIPKGTAVILKGSRLKSDDTTKTDFVMEPTQNERKFDGVNDLLGQDNWILISNTEYSGKVIYTLSAEKINGEDVRTVGFYKYRPNYFNANKAFFAVESTANNANGYLFCFDSDFEGGMPTNIISSIQEQKQECVIYNLSGQRLSKPMRGLNIINGKLVIKND